MKHGTTKTLRVGCILLAIFFLFCAFALLPQPVHAANTVTATVPVGSEPGGVAVTPNGAYAYVANYENNTASVISTATNTVTATATVGSKPTGSLCTVLSADLALTPNGAYAYVTNSGGTTVSVIDTSTNAVTATVTVGSEPVGVAVTPNGAYAYVTNYGSKSVSVISTATNAVTATVTVEDEPGGVAVTPNGAYVYVANLGSNSVSVISTATNAVTATVPVGGYPAGVAVTPNGAYVYVANSGNNSVSVISTATNAVTATVTGWKHSCWCGCDAQRCIRLCCKLREQNSLSD